MILDIGSGSQARGDVNVDLYTERSPHIQRDERIHKVNLVRADAHYLPFRSKAFKKAISFHLVEHVDDPCAVVSEARRVADSVEIVVPHAFAGQMKGIRISQNPTHRHRFSIASLRRLCTPLGRVQVGISDSRSVHPDRLAAYMIAAPKAFFEDIRFIRRTGKLSFRLPWEIKAIIT